MLSRGCFPSNDFANICGRVFPLSLVFSVSWGLSETLSAFIRNAPNRAHKQGELQGVTLGDVVSVPH